MEQNSFFRQNAQTTSIYSNFKGNQVFSKIPSTGNIYFISNSNSKELLNISNFNNINNDNNIINGFNSDINTINNNCGSSIINPNHTNHSIGNSNNPCCFSVSSSDSICWQDSESSQLTSKRGSKPSLIPKRFKLTNANKQVELSFKNRKYFEFCSSSWATHRSARCIQHHQTQHHNITSHDTILAKSFTCDDKFLNLTTPQYRQTEESEDLVLYCENLGDNQSNFNKSLEPSRKNELSQQRYCAVDSFNENQSCHDLENVNLDKSIYLKSINKQQNFDLTGDNPHFYKFQNNNFPQNYFRVPQNNLNFDASKSWDFSSGTLLNNSLPVHYRNHISSHTEYQSSTCPKVYKSVPRVHSPLTHPKNVYQRVQNNSPLNESYLMCSQEPISNLKPYRGVKCTGSKWFQTRNKRFMDVQSKTSQSIKMNNFNSIPDSTADIKNYGDKFLLCPKKWKVKAGNACPFYDPQSNPPFINYDLSSDLSSDYLFNQNQTEMLSSTFSKYHIRDEAVPNNFIDMQSAIKDEDTDSNQDSFQKGLFTYKEQQLKSNLMLYNNSTTNSSFRPSESQERLFGEDWSRNKIEHKFKETEDLTDACDSLTDYITSSKTDSWLPQMDVDVEEEIVETVEDDSNNVVSPKLVVLQVDDKSCCSGSGNEKSVKEEDGHFSPFIDYFLENWYDNESVYPFSEEILDCFDGDVNIT